MHDAQLITLINADVPAPAASRRLRVWLHAETRLRFRGGVSLAIEVAAHSNPPGGHALDLVWSCNGQHTRCTAYQPVSLASACGANVVPRAIAEHAGLPFAVLIEIEGIDRAPIAALECAA